MRRHLPHWFATLPQFAVKYSAVRHASAYAVSVGLWAPLVPITDAPSPPILAAARSVVSASTSGLIATLPRSPLSCCALHTPCRFGALLAANSARSAADST